MTDLANTAPGQVLHMAAPDPLTASTAARTISGRVVPFGKTGRTSVGSIMFTAGSLSWAPELRRVKLLTEHDQRSPVGYAIALEEREDGVYGTFHVPPGDAGDRALADAENSLRDAFSVGTQLDGATAERLRTAGAGTAVAGSGVLREVSLVSVPAFDDARVDSVAASAPLVVSAWTDALPDDPKGPTVTDDNTPTTPPADSPATPPATTTTTTTTPAPVPSTEPPVTVQAAAGAALVTGEPATYTFTGDGPSLCVDAAMASGGNVEARDRMARFNAELAAHNPATELALAAVLTRPSVPGALLPPQPTLSPIMLAVNAGRPLASRLTPTPIKNAQPFSVPVVGKFTGVGDHTEGTAHVAEGTLTVTDTTVTPKAISGAYRLSRELIDSANPAIDRIALDAMVIEYRQTSETRIAAALLAGAGSTGTGVNTVAEISAELLTFLFGNNDIPADFVALGASMFATIKADADTTGRPMLAPASVTVNSRGTANGTASANVDGSELVPSSKIGAAVGYAVAANSVLFAETTAQTFQLEQPEGPGIVKLAIWGYAAALVLNGAGVRKLTVA